MTHAPEPDRSAPGLTQRELEQQLAPWGQEHLLAFWDQLSAEQQRGLAEEVSRIDFAELAELQQEDHQAEDIAALAERAQGPPAVHLDPAENNFSREEALTLGRQALQRGELGVILVAGGQGTRLGFDHPKGMFPIGPVSDASLFQIFCETLVALSWRYQVRIPLYLMTSPATDAQTREYLAEHEYFGLPPDDVVIFCQGVMPAIDAETGRVLLAERGHVALSPDGHGGLLKAMHRAGALEESARRGVEHFFYMQVDNPLVRICDPEFIGQHLLNQSQVSTQVVRKRDPDEKVGNVVSVDGAVRIIEYSDLPAAAAQRRDEDGQLTLWAGNIAVHLFRRDFLLEQASRGGGLPFHRAKKKVPYLSAAGEQVEPAEPNALKFEHFIFDLLPAAERSIVVEVCAATTFAPVKNAAGTGRDDPDTARQQMITLYQQWLRAAGAEVPDNVPVEISPLFALDAEQLGAKITPRLRVPEPRYFR